MDFGERLVRQFQGLKIFSGNAKKFPFLAAIINRIVIFVMIFNSVNNPGSGIIFAVFYEKFDNNSQQFLVHGEGIDMLPIELFPSPEAGFFDGTCKMDKGAESVGKKVTRTGEYKAAGEDR